VSPLIKTVLPVIDCEKWCCHMLLCRPYTCSHLFIGDLKRAFYFLFSTVCFSTFGNEDPINLFSLDVKLSCMNIVCRRICSERHWMCSEHRVQNRPGGRAAKGKQTDERKGDDLWALSTGFRLCWCIWSWLLFPDLKPVLPCTGQCSNNCLYLGRSLSH